MGKSTLKPDVLKRINYLYQAAHLALVQKPDNTQLVRFYCHTLKSIARKNVLRLDLTMKRTLCKKCCLLLIPGITATVCHKGKPQPHITVRCLECHATKRFNTAQDYQSWTQKAEAWQPPVPARFST